MQLLVLVLGFGEGAMIRFVFVCRDAVVVPAINCMTSFFGGFAIFSVVGFMAHTLNKDVSKVVSSGKMSAAAAQRHEVTALLLSNTTGDCRMKLVTVIKDNNHPWPSNIYAVLCKTTTSIEHFPCFVENVVV